MKNLILAFVKFSGLSKIGVNLVNFKNSSSREQHPAGLRHREGLWGKALGQGTHLDQASLVWLSQATLGKIWLDKFYKKKH